MKKISVLIVLLCFMTSFSQIKSLDINSTMNEHLKNFRNNLEQNANIFIEFNYDYGKNISLNQHDYILETYINPKKLKSDNNFMVKFLIVNNNNQLILRAINFKIKKISNKKIEFINLMNGKDYNIID